MYYNFSSTSRFSTFEKKVCTFLSTFNFLVFQNWVCTFLLQLQNLKVKKNSRKKYFKIVPLKCLNALFSTLKTEKLRFTSIFHGFKKYFPKTQRLKLLAQKMVIIKYNDLAIKRPFSGWVIGRVTGF